MTVRVQTEMQHTKTEQDTHWKKLIFGKCCNGNLDNHVHSLNVMRKKQQSKT